MSLREMFLKGEYAEIVAEFDALECAPSRAQSSWMAASLALIGRIDDALQLGHAQDLVARFYVIVALIRSSRWERGDLAILDFIRTVDRDSEIGRFYVCQALGFRAFFEGRYKKALYWADLSWRASLRTAGLHERVLSSDLRGHAMIQMGHIEEGLDSLEKAFEIARRLGNKAHVGALRAAIAIVEVDHGYRTDETLRDLLEGARPLDSYTQVNILTALVRQANLRGRYRSALKLVAQTRPLVRVVRHKRQMASLAVREAYAHFRLGSDARALEILEATTAKLDRRDRAVLIEAKGLRLEILMERIRGRADGRDRGLKGLKDEVQKLAFEVKNRRSLSFVKRWSDLNVVLPGTATPIERWLSGSTDLHVRQELLEKDYLSFFEKLFDSRDQDAILLSLVPGKVVYRCRHELSVGDDKFSAVIRRGLFILARSRCSKSDLIQLVWGYQYESQRHDTLIYTFIRRLRVALGPLASRLTYSKQDDTYGFESRLKIKVLEFERELLMPSSPEVLESEYSQMSDFNLRQLDVLARLRSASRDARGVHAASVAAAELIEKFHVSRVTATRDLAELERIRLLVRTGAGRGTRYVLREHLARSDKKTDLKSEV